MKGRVAVVAAVLACMVVLTGCAVPGAAKPSIRFDNSYFYGKDGKFVADRAKDAYIALMRYHGYPVYPKMRESIWVSDYGTGQFAKLGLGARMWKNNTEHRYMLMDVYLLPSQMLPEHWHIEGEGNPVKLEGWLIRHGSSYVVGEEGPMDLPKEVVVPACHDGGKVTVTKCTFCGPGDFASLNRAKAHHWQFGGPDGAILTEVANCHTDSAVRHQDQKMNDNFLGK